MRTNFPGTEAVFATVTTLYITTIRSKDQNLGERGIQFNGKFTVRMLLQAEVRLAQEQARDAANARQQTETARLQLEGLHDQAVRASAELLQHIAALTGEKQSMQDSSASLQDLLSAKEVCLLQTRTNQECDCQCLGTLGSLPLAACASLAPSCSNRGLDTTCTAWLMQ